MLELLNKPDKCDKIIAARLANEIIKNEEEQEEIE
jgi:hypothetical protein